MKVSNFSGLGLLAVLASSKVQAQVIKPLEPVNGTGVVQIGLYRDDDKSYHILNGTMFSFYGQTYNGLTVSTNGTIIFGNTSYFTSNPNNTPLPRGTFPGLWVAQDDWIQPDIAAVPKGYMYYKIYADGIAITWVNMRHSPSINGGPTNTFQAYLYNNGDIAFGYDDLNKVDKFVVGINKGDASNYSSVFGTNSGQTAFNDTNLAWISKTSYLFQYNSGQYGSNVLGGVPISGTLNFEEIDPGASAQSVVFALRPVGSTASFNKAASVSANGLYQLNDLPRKQYVVHIKGLKYLATNVNVNATTGGVTGVNALLRAGDSDDDNFCDVIDLSNLIAAFGTLSGDPNFSADADFNSDGSVDVLDFDLLVRNFGVQGDE